MTRTAHWPPAFSLHRGLREAGGLVLAAAVLALLAAWLHPRRPDFGRHAYADATELTLAHVASLPEPVLWIDARATEAFAAGHIPTAVSLNEDRWEDLLPGVVERWQPGSAIVVYCDHRQCQSSQQVARRLRRDLGSDTVYVLHGGWQTWKEAHP